MRKILFIFALQLALLSTSFTTAETIITQEPPPNYIKRIIEIAENELGYVEQADNYSKYGVWSGNPNAQWCAEYLCWVVNQVDEKYGTHLLDSKYPNYSGQNTGRDWFLEHGCFVYRTGYREEWGKQWLIGSTVPLEENDYIPHAGDWLFTHLNGSGDTAHVAMVTHCTKEANGKIVVHVIEGNNPDRVQKNQYALDDENILGYGTPEPVVKTTLRYGNRGPAVFTFQTLLHELGLLDEKHLTSVYAANTHKAVENFQRDVLHLSNPNGIATLESQSALEDAYYRMQLKNPQAWLVVE